MSRPTMRPTIRQILPGAGLLLLLCGAAGARADSLQSLNEAQLANSQLNACFDQNYQAGRDKPGDQGRSAKRLLAACKAQWDAATAACQTATGNPISACRKQSGQLASDYLALKGPALQ